LKTSISAISYYLPEKILSNADLVNEFGTWTEDKIFKKTGIMERHVVTDEIVSDIAVKAAQQLFSENDVRRDEIDFLLLCTECPDYFMPATACVVQNRLGLGKNIGAYDMNLGCSGFVYGLATAKGLICAGAANNVLFITADTISKTIHPLDKSTRTLFGDAAAAVLVTKSESCGVLDFVFGTDGSGVNRLIIPAGAWAQPSSEATKAEVTNRWGNVRTKEHLYMDGPEIMNFTLDVVPIMFRDVLMKNNMIIDDIDHVVFHQASMTLLEKLRNGLNIPKEKFFINIENKGNTTSCTIPLALKDMQVRGLLQKEDKILLLGFGVGLSYAGTIINWVI
jgi:3-oxoacyl-[acyl-carrier-protein] synthase-3